MKIDEITGTTIYKCRQCGVMYHTYVRFDKVRLQQQMIHIHYCENADNRLGIADLVGFDVELDMEKK